MNRTEFIAKITELMGPGVPYTSEEHSTVYGTSWTLGPVVVRLFNQSWVTSRRLRPENVVTVTVNGARIVDNLVTSKTLLRAYDFARYNLKPATA
jgi:hypothetical protein